MEGAQQGETIDDLATRVSAVFRDQIDNNATTIARTECLLGDTPVWTTAPIVRAYRRLYSGDVVQITTARGHQLTTTPNHPIFTDRGWVPSGSLVEGDSVFSRLTRQGMGAGDPDVENMPATIAEIYGAIAETGLVERKALASVDFHGDGQPGDVDVVRAIGDLRLCASIGTNQRQELAFSLSYPGKGLGVDGSQARQRLGGLGFAEGRLAGSTAGLAIADEDLSDSRPRQSVSFAESRERKAASVQLNNLGRGGLNLGLTEASNANSPGSQHLQDGTLITSEDSRNVPAVLAGIVTADNVVRVERRPFAGHVYNLQTEDGTYAGANIITHNCIQAYGGASIQAYRDGGIEQAQMYDGTEFDEECAAVDGQVVSLDEADQLMADEHPNGTRGVAPIVDSAILLEAAADPTLLLYKAVKAIEQMAEKTQANNAVANQAAKDVEAVKDDQFAQLLTLLTTIVTKEQVAPVVNFNPTIDATSKFEKGALQVNMPEPKRKGPLVIKHPDGRRTEVDRGE